MDDVTEKAVTRVIEQLGHVHTFRCRYQDLSFAPDVNTDRLVEVVGESGGRLHLRTVNGTPDAETVITQRELIRVDHTNKNGYRIDFSRHPFTDFHRYGWLRLDHPFALIDSETLRFRAEIEEPGPTLLFEAKLNSLFFGEWTSSNAPPTAQLKLDSKTGLLRELLILSQGAPQRFVFTNYVVNRRLGRHAFMLVPRWAIGDLTDLYWNQICVAHDGEGPSAPFFSLN